MHTRPLPAKDKLTLCFAHVAYCMGERFALRNTGLDWFEVRSLDDLKARIAEVDVLLCSGLWRNELIPAAGRLAFIQSISAGTDQYSRDALGAAGIRVASAQGVNERAVAEHAIALILAMARRIPEARDNQTATKWRGMIGDISQREDELGGKTVLIAGFGRIGSRLATLAKAFDMRVIAIRRDPSKGAGVAGRRRGMEVAHGQGVWRALASGDRAVGGGRHAPARRRTRRAVDGRGYQVRRWSNSYSGAGWAWGSQSPAPASGRSHSGGPRAGAIRGGAVGSPRWTRMSRMGAGSVMKAMMRISAPQWEHTSGNTS